MRSAIRSKTDPVVSDAERHSLEDGSGRFRSHEAQPQAPALPGVGVDQAHERVGIRGDVRLALVEELKREGDVIGVDVLHVTDDRGVRHAVGGARVEHCRNEPLERGRERFQTDHASAPPVPGPGV
jgi:hypothetical protein